MSRTPLVRATALAACAFLALPLAAATPPAVVTPGVRPDQALLYLIRPHGAVGGNAVTMHVYANEELIGAIKGDSYGTAYLAPGRYVLFIHLGFPRVLEFVPGQTYYLLCSLDTGATLMTETDGRALMTKAPRYMPFDPAEHAKARGKGAARFAKFKPADYSPAAASPAAPERAAGGATGELRIAAYSPVELELMEMVSSALTKSGSRVWFRVLRDAQAEGGVWLRAGTPVAGTLRLGQQSAGGGVSGVLEIEIPELPSAGGAAIPVVGQVASAGASRTGSATTAFAFGGFLGASLVKGREAYHLPGVTVTVFTRGESWAPEAPQAAEPSPADTATEAPLAVEVALVARIDFAPGKANPPGPVAVRLATDQPLADLALVEVDGWPLPTPAKARSGAADPSGWLASFDGWELVRHLRAGKTATPVRFEGHLADGRPVVATGAMSWTPGE